MALNLPMPDIEGSFGKGFGITDNLMKQILERRQLKQLDEHFKKEYGLKSAAAGRNAQLFPYRLQELQDKHAAAAFERNMMNQLLGAGTAMGSEGGNQMPPEEKTMPTEEIGQGMGALSPEAIQQGLQASQHQPNQPTPHGLDPKFAALMQNPMMRGWFKHKFGYDPLAPSVQTPEEKQAAAIDLFKQKEAIKAQGKGGDIPTNTVLTQNQQAVQGIDSTLPILDELIADKDLPGITNLSPGAHAKYIAKTGGVIDTLVAAQSLPKVQASIDLVEKQIRRHTGETVHDYKERLKDLKKDLIKRRERSQTLIKTRKVNTSPIEDFTKMSDEELHKIVGGG